MERSWSDTGMKWERYEIEMKARLERNRIEFEGEIDSATLERIWSDFWEI